MLRANPIVRGLGCFADVVEEARVIVAVFDPRHVLARCRAAVSLYGRAVFPSSPRRA
ncbi:Hypothetical protein A7982_01416 [Minicystis rosea]|nr:Hypothetical protein A7982_01416 [Minicystis rosea]